MATASKRSKIRKHFKIALRLPVAVFVVVTAIAFAAHHRFVELEDEAVRTLASKRLDSLSDQLAQAFEERDLSLERMARRLDYTEKPDRGAWVSDATTYRQHLKGLNSIAVLDAKNAIKWISSNSELDELALKTVDPSVWDDTVSEARDRKRTTISHRLKGDFAAALVVVPLFHKGLWVGSLISLNRLDMIINTLFKLDGYEIELRENGQVLFSNITQTQNHLDFWSSTGKLTLANQIWDFKITPTPSTVSSHRSNLPHVVLLSTILGGILLSAIIHLMLSLRLRTRAIEEQRVFLDTVIDNLPVAVFCKDHEDDMKFSVWNKTCEDLFGLTKDQTLGRTALDLFHGNSIRTLSEQPVGEGVNCAIQTTFEERVVTDSAGAVLLQTRKICILDKQGQPLYTLGISEDVSKRRSAELALKDSEQKFASFMENTPVLNWIRNDEGRLTFANTKFCETFGVTSDTIVGRMSLPGIPDDVRRQGLLNDAKVMKDRNNLTTILPIVNAEGKRRHFMILKFPMLLASGAELVGATAIDISDRIEAENTLAETTKTLKALIDSSPLPILTLDLNGLVQLWSPACEKVFGWSAEEVIGKPLPFVSPHRRSESKAIIQEIINAGSRGYQADAIREKKDGTSIELRIEAMVLIDEVTGKSTGLVAVMNDVSQQKLAERKLREAKKQAEVAASMKADFLANVSHEIRTPLNGIIGMTDILLESGLTEEQKKYATIVHNSGSILLNLINDILDLSKIEAGKMTLEKTPFSLVPLVESHADLLIAKARENGLSLMTYVDSNLPAQVIGDPSRLAQVLVNLIGNAIKFTQSGGVSVRVSLDPSNLYDSPTTVRVCFEVQDTGIGLSETARKKLFLPFSQAESSTNRRFGGTGLGLSISKNLIETMGGTIGVNSVEGQGSTFWFVVPLEKQAAPALVSNQEIKAFENSRVLIVDDDTIATDIITRYLASWGISHNATTTYKNALQEIIRAQAANESYQLVLVGQGKKAALGYNLAAEVQFGLGGLAPKMILMTPFETRAATDASKNVNFAAVISKPLKQSQLFDCISKVLNPHAPAKLRNTGISKTLTSPGESNVIDVTAKSSTSPGTAPVASAPVTGLSVLVADDVSTNQIIALKLLESLGHSGHAVGNGREAIEALELRAYDIVLMDCQMPEVDGFEATKLIRASSNARTAGSIIIALTANAMNGDRERCIAAGMNDYLSKPIKKDKLSEMLNRWVPELKKHG